MRRTYTVTAAAALALMAWIVAGTPGRGSLSTAGTHNPHSGYLPVTIEADQDRDGPSRPFVVEPGADAMRRLHTGSTISRQAAQSDIGTAWAPERITVEPSRSSSPRTKRMVFEPAQLGRGPRCPPNARPRSGPRHHYYSGMAAKSSGCSGASNASS